MSNNILGELEQKIMDVVWSSNKPLKPSDVLANLDKTYAYTTIMTVLSRLSEKNILKRAKKGNTYFYSAKKKKEDYASKNLKELFLKLISSYKDLALAQFVDAMGENPEELKKLEEYIKKNKNAKK